MTVAPILMTASPMVNVLPRPTGGRNESGVGAMHPSGEANSSGMTGSRQRRAVRYKGGIAHRKCIAPANGCASPIVNVSPLPTDGRNESGVGAMHPSGVANSFGVAGPRQRRADPFKGGIAHRERIASTNGSASPIMNVSPWSRRGRNEPGRGAMHPSDEAESNRNGWAAAEVGRPVQGRHRPL